MSECLPWAVLFVGALLYFLLAPLVLGRTLLRRFDGDLFTPTYWQSIEQVLPFYRYRRAMMYLGMLGWTRFARHRFPGYDFRRKSSPGLRLASWLYNGAAAIGIFVAAYNAVVGLPCNAPPDVASRAEDCRICRDTSGRRSVKPVFYDECSRLGPSSFHRTTRAPIFAALSTRFPTFSPRSPISGWSSSRTAVATKRWTSSPGFRPDIPVTRS
jgi:hypothetical protein